MCRGLIHTFAVMLRVTHLAFAVGGPNFRWLLKKVWRGNVTWTGESEFDLQFWDWVPGSRLWSSFGYEVFSETMKDYVRHTRVGELAEVCRTVASDASDLAVGVACLLLGVVENLSVLNFLTIC